VPKEKPYQNDRVGTFKTIGILIFLDDYGVVYTKPKNGVVSHRLK
jgi:hypothetical protein